MTISRRIAFALLFGASLSAQLATVQADDRTVFAGCVTARGDKSIMLDTSGGELVTIDTSWLKPTMYDALTEDCVTVTTVLVDGKYMAESVEAGDEPNEVHNDRERREKEKKEDDQQQNDHDDN